MPNFIIKHYTKSTKSRIFIASTLLLMPFFLVCSILFTHLGHEIYKSNRQFDGLKILNTATDIRFRLNASKLGPNHNLENQGKNVIYAQISALKDIKLSPKVRIALDNTIAKVHAIKNTNQPDIVNIDEAVAQSNLLIQTVRENYNLYLDPDPASFFPIRILQLNDGKILSEIVDFGLQNENTSVIDRAILRSNLEQTQKNYKRDAELIERWAKAGETRKSFSVAFAIERDKVLQLLNIKNEPTIDGAYDAVLSVHKLENLAVSLGKAAIEQRIIRQFEEFGFVIICSLILCIIFTGIVSFMMKKYFAIPLQQVGNVLLGAETIDKHAYEEFLDRKDEVGLMARTVEKYRQNIEARILAEKANNTKSEFLAVLSHEIRTPMNGVMGMVQALSKTELNDKQQELVKILGLAGKHLNQILDGILDIAKIENNQIELENIKFSPVKIADSNVKLFNNLAEEKGISLKLNVKAQGLAEFYIGDGHRIGQIVTNLLSNAIKFTEVGVVTLNLEADADDNLIFSIEDTGIGIHPEIADKLFDKFTQGDSSHTRLYGGAGLGLSICNGLANAMNAKIWFESKFGKGTKFYLKVPLQKVETSDATQETEIKADIGFINDNIKQADESSAIVDVMVETQESAMAILVVEDNITNVIVLRALLEQIGLNFDVAENGKIGYEMWCQKHYDLVIMDIQMPIWDGLTAIRAIRAFESDNQRLHTPIVALSANAMSHHVAEQLNAGADTHAPKPIQLEILMSAIEEAMDIADGINNKEENQRQIA